MIKGSLRILAYYAIVNEFNVQSSYEKKSKGFYIFFEFVND